jgi:voltage-gated potassium channel
MLMKEEGKNKAGKLSQIRWNAQSKDGQVMLSLPWEIFVLGLALLSIFNLILAFLLRDPSLSQVVAVMDGIIILVFLGDLIRRLSVADDKRRYIVDGWGWVDAISIVPLLRIARLLRVIRVIRVMQRMGGPSEALTAFFKNRATGGLLLVLLIALLVLEFGSLLMLWAESTQPDANITTAEDSIWYLIVTMSTVGYGDLYPVSLTGRVIGSAIIIVGVGVFGTLTGFLATIFLTPDSSEAEAEDLEVETTTEGAATA